MAHIICKLSKKRIFVENGSDIFEAWWNSRHRPDKKISLERFICYRDNKKEILTVGWGFGFKYGDKIYSAPYFLGRYVQRKNIKGIYIREIIELTNKEMDKIDKKYHKLERIKEQLKK